MTKTESAQLAKSRSGTRQIPLNNNALIALERLQQLQENNRIKTNYVICTSTGKMVVQNSYLKEHRS